MTRRHPYFDPHSSFRRLCDSIPADTRARDYFEWLQAAHEKATPGKELVQRRGRLAGDPERAGERLLCAVTEIGAEPLEAHIDLDRLNNPSRLHIQVTVTDPGTMNGLVQPTPCGLFLIEPHVLRGLFEDVPELQPERTGGLRQSLSALMKSENLSRFPVARAISGLPEADGEMVNGVAEFGFLLPAVFEGKKLLDHVHMVALVNRSPA
jgi:hypothetical protein